MIMVTSSETRKLRNDMRRELDGGVCELWKCAAGLIVLFSITLAAPGTGSMTNTAGSQTYSAASR
jgi:hypothetical protein